MATDPATAASRIAKSQYNSRNAGVKRILQEAKELARDDSDKAEFHAAPLEDSLHDWHFTIRGPSDSEFQDGIYHGRITLPTEYPMRPPNIMLLTPNGRFELNKKICLTITGYHEELWQPAWGIRTAVMALVSFFTTEAQGQVGGIDTPAADRRRLAALSHDWACPHCARANKDILHPRSPPSNSASTTPSVTVTSATPPSTTPSSPPSQALPHAHIIPPPHSPTVEAPLSAVELGRPGPVAHPPPQPRSLVHTHAHAHARVPPSPGAQGSGVVGLPVERAPDSGNDEAEEQDNDHDVVMGGENDDEDRLIAGQVARNVPAPATAKIDAVIAVLVFMIAALVVRKLTPGDIRED